MLDDHGQPEYAINFQLRLDRAVDELLGLARGMIADGTVTESESRALRTWAGRNPDLCVTFPGQDLYQRLTAIYADGRVDDDEREELLWFLQGLAGDGQVTEDESVGGSSTLPLTVPPPRISHEGASTRRLSGSSSFARESLSRLIIACDPMNDHEAKRCTPVRRARTMPTRRRS